MSDSRKNGYDQVTRAEVEGFANQNSLRAAQVNTVYSGWTKAAQIAPTDSGTPLPDCILRLSQRAEYLKKQLEDKIAMENELKSIELMLNALKATR